MNDGRADVQEMCCSWEAATKQPTTGNTTSPVISTDLHSDQITNTWPAGTRAPNGMTRTRLMVIRYARNHLMRPLQELDVSGTKYQPRSNVCYKRNRTRTPET